MTTDRELLRRYVHEASEEAFTEVVHRHVNLVYGVAVRQLCGNAAMAQDVTQAVFTALAAKAGSLTKLTHLSAWLHTTTRFTVSHLVRTERRRQDREQKAHTMQVLLTEAGPEETPAVPPELIETVLAGLAETDREAVLRRFLEDQSFSAIGQALEVSEDAARMRVARALESIRAQLARRGITSSTAAISAVLAHQAVAAPVSLAAGVSAAAMAGTAALTGAKIGLVAIMTTTKSTIWLASTAVLAIGFSVYQYRTAVSRDEQAAQLTVEHRRLEEALRQSEQRAAQAERQAAQAEQPVVELQGKPNKIPPTMPVPPGMPASRARTRDAERMARMRPSLEKGAPIKGAIVVMVDGKPKQRLVEFVMGKETRIEAVDDGTYVVTPRLNPDGSVRYAIILESKDTVNGVVQTRTTTLSDIIQTPWAGFALAIDNGAVMAFDPDND